MLTHTHNAKERGLSVIFITHNLDHVYQVTDRLTISRRGKVVGAFTRHKVNEDDIADLTMGERENWAIDVEIV